MIQETHFTTDIESKVNLEFEKNYSISFVRIES